MVSKKSKWILYISSIYILISLTLAFFGYLVCTDQTQYCNTQVPTLALQQPGFKACFQKDSIPEESLFSIWLGGRKIISPKTLVSEKSDIGKNLDCKRYFLGTDRFGRDLYSRIVVGMRYTILVGILSVMISIILGIGMGALSGYFGGITDQIISFVINVFWSLPTVLLAFVILMVFGRNLGSIMVAIGLTMWGDMARLVRGQTLQARALNYITASKALGFHHYRIIFLHILPNIMGPVWIQISANFGLAILLESGLSFLGLGLQPPIPTLGNIMQEQYTLAYGGDLILAVIPVIVLVLLIVSFHIITQSLRERMDTKTKEAVGNL
ncbi:MAG: ABC transporter permease [Saprospiraceae bacterium]|nr:ABC transporter permease [Saprospiraceae bacterium]